MSDEIQSISFSCILSGSRIGPLILTTTTTEIVYGIWNAVAGGDSMPAVQASMGVGTYYTGETPQNALDQSLFTKYSTTGNSTGAGLYNGYAGLNTGFYLTLSQCAAAPVQVRIGTGNDLTERDPLSITIEGSNGGDLTTGSSWTLIYSGSTGLANVTDRETFGPYQSISSMGSFASLRFLVTSKRDYSDYVQYSEVEFFGCCYGCCITPMSTITTESSSTVTCKDSDIHSLHDICCEIVVLLKDVTV